MPHARHASSSTSACRRSSSVSLVVGDRDSDVPSVPNSLAAAPVHRLIVCTDDGEDSARQCASSVSLVNLSSLGTRQVSCLPSSADFRLRSSSRRHIGACFSSGTRSALPFLALWPLLPMTSLLAEDKQ